MKRLIMLLAAAAIAAPAIGQGVEFESLTMKEARQKAARQDKYVFVDCYTSWCGPCKKMTAEVFPQKEVGDYFATRFVAVKYDIEKEEDGKALAAEHNVSVIPTYLIIKPDGSLLHRFAGAYDTDTFLRKVDESFDDDKAYGSLKKAYEEGNRNREFLEKALRGFTSVRDPQTQEVLAQLVDQLTDREKRSPDYWFIYATDQLDTIGSRNEQYLFDNAAKFRKQVGPDKVDPVLARHYEERFRSIIGLREDTDAKEVSRMAKQVAKSQLEGDVNSLAAIATAVKGGSMAELVKVAAAEMPNMNKSMEAYFMLSDRIFDHGTTELKHQWIALGESLLPTIPQDKKSWMEALLKIKREELGM